jgi:hypothetical protein
MKLLRIASMSPAEILVRAGQELSKRIERSGMIGGREPVTPENTRRKFRNQSLNRARFFKGAASRRTTEILDRRIPAARAQTIARAEEICNGRFSILGYPSLSYGNPIDWHLDPVSGIRAPQRHWSRIDPLDPRQVGDSKVVWELNRHQWAVTLGQAYRYTGDERYVATFVHYIKDWMQANPSGMGINWSSSLEAAYRAIAWCWALFLFRGSKTISKMMLSEMLEWVRVHMRHVEKYLSYYFSPNTHLTGEALGLFYAGLVFPGFNEAERWRKLGQRILLEQLERQVHADGVYFEQSTCYQRYTVDIYLHFLILAQHHGIAVPDCAGQSVQRMIDFLVSVRRPDGSMPQLGDADGGMLLPLAGRVPDDFRGLFATAAALFKRPDYAWAAGGLTPELVWLLGPAGCQAFDGLPQTPPESGASRLFVNGGYAVMRSGWEPEAHQLIFDAGPLGCNASAGHGHADLLSLQCAVFGRPFLTDPGTCAYTGDTLWREHFRSSMAHNTVTIDGLSQAESAGPFKWRQRPCARLRRWLSTGEFDLADAEHDAYHRLADPVTHRRRVFFSKPRYWLIVDDLSAKSEHRIDLCFQFAASTQLIPQPGHGWVNVRYADGSGCYLLVFSAALLQAQQFCGGIDSAPGCVAPDYGRREPAPALRYSGTSQLPLRIFTLIVPYDGEICPSPPIVTASVPHGLVNLKFEDLFESLRIGDEDIVMRRNPPVPKPAVKSLKPF